jgi:hypothetical protein
MHRWHKAVFITAFLFSEETTIALEGQAFSQSLQPTQASLSTFSDNVQICRKFFEERRTDR